MLWLEAVRTRLGPARLDAKREGATERALRRVARRSPEILHDDRVRPGLALRIRDLEDDARAAARDPLEGQASLDANAAQRRLGEHARQDEERQQQRQHQVEQVVPGVERGKADREHQREEEPAGAGRPQPPRRPQRTPQSSRQRGTAQVCD